MKERREKGIEKGKRERPRKEGRLKDKGIGKRKKGKKRRRNK